MPEIACIVPTHKRPHLLIEALDSILKQTLRPSEIVVVDDAQDAETQETLTRWTATSDLPTKYVAIPAITKGSAGRSRNAGVDHSSSPVLAFLDDDDRWLPTHLEDALTLLHNADLSFTVSGMRQLRGDIEYARLQMKPQLSAADVLSRNPGFTGSNFVIRRSAYLSVRGFDEALRVANDLDLLVRLLDEGHRYDVTSNISVEQNGHDGDQITSITHARSIGIETYRLKYFNRLSHKDRRELARSIHSIRRITSGHIIHRGAHTILQALNSTPRQLMSAFGKAITGRRSAYHD